MSWQARGGSAHTNARPEPQTRKSHAHSSSHTGRRLYGLTSCTITASPQPGSQPSRTINALTRSQSLRHLPAASPAVTDTTLACRTQTATGPQGLHRCNLAAARQSAHAHHRRHHLHPPPEALARPLHGALCTERPLGARASRQGRKALRAPGASAWRTPPSREPLCMAT